MFSITDQLTFSLTTENVCQDSDLIRQGVQQLQNKINQFQKRDGLNGIPLLWDQFFKNTCKNNDLVEILARAG